MSIPHHTVTGRSLPPVMNFKHFGYVVDSIPQAASQWAASFGVGPFLTIDDVSFDELVYSGGPAVYDHSVAFAQWGSVTIELMQFHSVEPESLARRMATPTDRLNHLGYSVPDLQTERERLEALGAEAFLTARTGDVEGLVLWAPHLGHSIELLVDSEFVRGFPERLAAASEGWDGAELLRPLER